MRVGLISYTLCAFIIAALVFVVKAEADTEGISGKLIGLQVVNPGSDTFSTFRGSIFIRESFGIVQEYKWGGSTCTGNISIEDSDIANFSRLLNSRTPARIIPIYKNGQGGNRCIKRYIIVNRFFEDGIVFIVD